MSTNGDNNYFYNLLVGALTAINIFNFKQGKADRKEIDRLAQENKELKEELSCLKNK